MTGSEFLRRLQRYARARGLSLTKDRTRGKGDHIVIWLDGRFSVVPDFRHELKTGTLRGICKQLGIDPRRL